MGIFSHQITVLSADGSRSEVVDALVDTGSTYFWLTEVFLRELGYQPVVTRQLVTATGEEVERGLAPVLVRLNDETLPVLCIFGDETSRPLIGAMVLEAFSLGVDPVNQKLVPIPALAMAEGAARS